LRLAAVEAISQLIAVEAVVGAGDAHHGRDVPEVVGGAGCRAHEGEVQEEAGLAAKAVGLGLA
jgi:hypothetical protein